MPCSKTPQTVGGIALFDAGQVMQLTGLSYAAILRAGKRGDLRTVRIGGRVFYPSAQFTCEPAQPAPPRPRGKPGRPRKALPPKELDHGA